MAAAKKIREDLFGTITVHTTAGTVFLRAGDKVPAGVDVAASQLATVGAHRADPEESKEADDDAGNRRGRRSSTRRGDS